MIRTYRPWGKAKNFILDTAQNLAGHGSGLTNVLCFRLVCVKENKTNYVHLITYMKKLLDSDWLRAVQLMSNISAKSVIPVQITNQNSWIRSSVHRCKRLECFLKFRKPPITFENFPRVFEVFWTFPNISEHFWTLSKIYKFVGRLFWELSDIFRYFPKNSEDFRQFPKI